MKSVGGSIRNEKSGDSDVEAFLFLLKELKILEFLAAGTRPNKEKGEGNLPLFSIRGCSKSPMKMTHLISVNITPRRS